MRKVFSDEQLMQKWLDCWKALAQAEADVGIVPRSAAEHIAQCAKSANMNMQAVREGFAKTCHPLMPQIREFERVCGEKAGAWIHWGATTQDIMDTAVVLQLKDTRVTSKISNEILDEVLEPINYTGSCEAMVEKVVAKLKDI